MLIRLFRNIKLIFKYIFISYLDVKIIFIIIAKFIFIFIIVKIIIIILIINIFFRFILIFYKYQ